MRTLLGLWFTGALIVGLGFEACYRLQWIDFYRPDLRRVNDAGALDPGRAPRRTILVMGDSFTAWPNGYPSRLSQRLGPGTRVINSGVSGFTLRQVARLLPRRIAEFRPDTVVLQLFAGNDLVEMEHPLAWTKVSPLRNLFWLVSNSGLESVGFVNYRLGSLVGSAMRGFRGDSPVGGGGGPEAAFSVSRYSEHEKTLIAAEPDYVEQQLEVSLRYRPAYSEYLSLLQRSFDLIDPAARKIVVLVVPHPLQVHERYLERHRILGGVAGHPRAIEPSTAFLRGLAGLVSSHPGIRLVDPLEALRVREREGVTLFRATDLHLNAAGQEVLTELLLPEIETPARGSAPVRSSVR